MKILATGLSGLVGSRIAQLLSPSYVFEDMSLESGVDITDRASIETRIRASDAEVLLHLAAFTDVQGAEKTRQSKQESAAWKVNVDATRNIAQLCKQTGKRVIYFDTDYAFDGTRKTYSEDDQPNPQGWYAITKTEGAKIVLALGSQGLVLRISNPFRAFPVGKKDFVHKMLERLADGRGITAPTDQLFAPTFIDDLAAALNVLLTQSASGVFHAVGGQAISPFDAGVAIARQWGFDPGLVRPTTFAEMFKDRAPIPQYAALSNGKISSLGIRMSPFSEGIASVYTQETSQNTG